MNLNRKWLIGVLALLALMVALVNAQLSQNHEQEFAESSAGRAFLEAYGALQSDYLEEVDNDKIIEGAIQGMLDALEDPYTSYATPEQADRRMQDITGEFEGIGATLQARDRDKGTTVEIVSVFRASPAWEAGLQRGDIFAEVDGVDVREATIEDIVSKVRGPKGSAVELGMIRPGVEGLVYFTVVRDTIEIIEVESTILPDAVGYLSIRTFGTETVHDQLVAELAALEEQGVTSLILDLRDNPGGLLTQGLMVANEFLSEGDIAFQRARGMTQRLAAADEHYFDLPMVVLVNNNSASASEIVAGALQDHGRAQVVGEETFGKGVGQSLVPLANGGQLTLLSFEWLTPDQMSINQQGVKPDIDAADTRFPSVIEFTGDGAAPGQEIEIVIDGELIGKATAEDDGSFSFFQPIERTVSEVPGEAIVDLDADDALRTAFEAVLDATMAEAR